MTEEGITLELAGGREGFRQPIAGRWLRSDLPVAPGALPAPPPPRGAIRPAGRWRLVFRGPATVEGALEEVAAWRSPAGDRRIDFADGERFWVAAGGERVVRLPPRSTPLAGERLLERAVGAPLALALAARGIFLLHASALAARGGGVVAITGASGAGKSTLAAAAAGHPDLGLERVADDILPVRLGEAPAALPHFPQLKLSPAAQYPPSGPATLALTALVAIEHSPSASAVERCRRSPAEALLALVRSTVAARLFDAELAAAHFAACADAGRVLPVVRLRFPSGPEGLRAALAELAGLAAGGAPGPAPTARPPGSPGGMSKIP